MIRKTLFGLAAIAALSIGSFAFAAPAMAADHTWGPHMAISSYKDDVYYMEGDSESDARNLAMTQCGIHHRTGCTAGKSVPLYEGWEIAVVYCDDGHNWYDFEGASQTGGAWDYAWSRSSGYRQRFCTEIPSDDWIY